jgi:hypothetical protein
VTAGKPGHYMIISVSILMMMSLSAFTAVIPSDTIRNVRKEVVENPDSVTGKVINLPQPGVKPEHSPRKAAIYSAVLPGLGQVYNRKWWKIPIVYGGFATLGYFIKWNNGEYITAKNAYKDLTDNDPGTDSYLKLKQIQHYNLNNPNDLATLEKGLTGSQDYFRRNRDLLIILTFGFYGLNIIDASVDGHFFNFDISDDLTMKVKPTLVNDRNQNILSLNCTFNF